MKIDPDKYVIAVPGGYAILPFHEDVGLALVPQYTGRVWTKKEVLEEVKDIDISLVVNHWEWKVSWMKGSELTFEDLINLI